MKIGEKVASVKHACQLSNLQDLEIINSSGAGRAAVERQAVRGSTVAARTRSVRSVTGLQCGAVSPALILECQHRSTTAIHHRRDRLQHL